MSTFLRSALARHSIAVEDASEEHVDATGPVEDVPQYEQDLDAGQLVDANQDVIATHDDDARLDVVMEGLKELRSMVGTINKTRGFNQQSLKYLNLATEAVTVPVFGHNPVKYALEDGGAPPPRGDETAISAGTPQQVDIDSLEKTIQAVERASEETFTSRIDTERNMFIPIADMIAGSVSRLGSTSEQAKIRANENEGEVEIDDNMVATLFVNGVMPEDIVAYVQDYVDLGTVLTGDYLTRAIDSGQEAHSFANHFSFDSKEAFWASVGEKVAMIGDPRIKLTEKQKTLPLPGAGPLFDKADVSEENAVDDVPQVLRIFSHQYRPAPLKMKPNGQATTVPALTLSQIRTICDGLLGLFKSFKISEIQTKLTPIFDDAASSVYQTRDVLNQSSLHETDIGLQEQLVVDYLKTVYSLTSLPILGYLTNLTIFTNSIVILAQRSFEAKPAPVPVDTVVEGGDLAADPLAAGAAEAPADGAEVAAVPGEEGGVVDEFAVEEGGDVAADAGADLDAAGDLPGEEAVPGAGDVAGDEFVADEPEGPTPTTDAMTDAIAEGTDAVDAEAPPADDVETAVEPAQADADETPLPDAADLPAAEGEEESEEEEQDEGEEEEEEEQQS